jgi:hypothetical protein
MATTLSICTKEEQRAVVHFLWAEGVEGVGLSAQYGDNMLPQHSVYEWTEMFKNDWTSVTDAKCSGHSFTSTSDDKEK